MDDKTFGALLAFLALGIFVILPFAMLLYRTGVRFFDGWIWLFTGKHPGSKKKQPSKQTPSQTTERR